MKTFGGVVLGYLMMFAFVFLSLSVAYRIMGGDLAFQPGVYDVTNLWIITSFMLGLAGAILGGYMCEAIARDERAPKLLAVLVLLRGCAFAIRRLLLQLRDRLNDLVPAMCLVRVFLEVGLTSVQREL